MNWFDWFNGHQDKHPQPCPRQRRAVLALGGGGARGLAHLGVIQAIGESGIQTERIVGVSIGSLLGGLWAVEPDIRKVQAKAIEFLFSPTFQAQQQLLLGDAASGEVADSGGVFGWYSRLTQVISAHRRFNRAVTAPSLLSNDMLKAAIDFLLPDIELRELPTPMSVVCVDLLSGQRIVLESGSLRTAVLASMAIPGFYPPITWGKMLLCDIGVFDSLPTSIARTYASDLTIGVDVGLDRSKVLKCNTAMEAMVRMQDISERLLRRESYEAADIVIRPQVGHVAWFDFRKPEDLIQAGWVAGQRSLSSFQQDNKKITTEVPTLKSA